MNWVNQITLRSDVIRSCLYAIREAAQNGEDLVVARNYQYAKELSDINEAAIDLEDRFLKGEFR